MEQRERTSAACISSEMGRRSQPQFEIWYQRTLHPSWVETTVAIGRIIRDGKKGATEQAEGKTRKILQLVGHGAALQHLNRNYNWTLTIRKTL